MRCGSPSGRDSPCDKQGRDERGRSCNSRHLKNRRFLFRIPALYGEAWTSPPEGFAGDTVPSAAGGLAEQRSNRSKTRLSFPSGKRAGPFWAPISSLVGRIVPLFSLLVPHLASSHSLFLCGRDSPRGTKSSRPDGTLFTPGSIMPDLWGLTALYWAGRPAKTIKTRLNALGVLKE